MEIVGDADNIMYVRGLLTPDFSQSVVELFDGDEQKAPGKVYNEKGELTASDDKITVELEILPKGQWQEVHEAIHASVSEAVKSYASSRPALQVSPLQNTAYKIKMYEPNVGQFHWHFDAKSKSTYQRQIALVIYLNSVEKGGETGFYHQQIDIKPEAGSAILFPPFWTHLHCGRVPQSGRKYAITSFVEFKV